MTDSFAPPGSAAQAPGAFRILDLPTELVRGVLSFVDRGEALLFSMTCRAAHSVVFGEHAPNTRTRSVGSDEQQFAFLELLARDLPYHFVCDRCRMLHSHRRLLEDEEEDGSTARGDESLVASLRRRPDPGRGGLVTFGPLWPQHGIGFDEARAALERNRAPPGSGPRAVPQLAVATGWKRARLGASCNNPDLIYGYVKLDAEAVVTAEGALHLHRTHRALIAPGSAASFLRTNAEAPMEHVFQPCRHRNASQDLFPVGPRLAAALKRGRSVREMLALVAEALAGCRAAAPCGPEGFDAASLPDVTLAGCLDCMTEYVVTLHNHGRAGVEIVADSYQDFDACAAPDDFSWLQFSTRGSYFDQLELRFAKRFASTRKLHTPVRPSEFPTPAGRSAQKHPSAPSPRDIWELHDYERRARSTWS
ncbi:hypothetical protein F4818DRAFT_321164 [Hypoxylon cercidicola]|nr:hypothetical protein F4818DRAFT_321164 [Hypoxylon cercidicola]